MEERSKLMNITFEGHFREDLSRLKDEQQNSNQFSVLLSNLYCLMLILFGVMFPLAEALQNYWLESHFNGIFLVYLYALSALALVYIQTFSIPKSKRQDTAARQAPTQRYRQASLSCSNACQSSMVTDGNWQLRDSNALHTEHDLPTPRVRSRTFGPDKTPSFEHYGETRVRSGSELFDIENPHPGSFIAEVNSTASQCNEETHARIRLDSHVKPASGHGSSFYLRLGTLLFALGNIIYIGLEIDFYFSPDVPDICNSATYGWTFILQLIFVLLQTFFLFKNAQVNITVQQPVARFCFKHLIATNICIWTRTLTNEIVQHAHHMVHGQTEVEVDEDINSARALGENASINPITVSTTPVYEDCDEAKALLLEASPYLFPFVLEYSLIAAGTFTSLCAGVGAPPVNLLHNIKQALLERFAEPPKQGSADVPRNDMFSPNGAADTVLKITNSDHNKRMDFSSSHRGMFLGFLCLGGAFIAIIMYFGELSKNTDESNKSAQLCYLITDMTFEVLLIIASVMALYSTRKLWLKSKHLGVDDILLLIAMAGSCLFEISLIVSNGFYLVELNKDESDEYLELGPGDSFNEDLIILSLVLSVLACLQILLQTILILSGLRRYTPPEQHTEKKPGRGAITFLVVTNVTLWIFGAVQIKNIELGIQEDFYGTIAWLFILNLNLPLYLFYRFHSSVCLADIWNDAYKPLIQNVVTDGPKQTHAEVTNNPAFSDIISEEYGSISIFPE